MKPRFRFAHALALAAGAILTVQTASACANPLAGRARTLLPMVLRGAQASQSGQENNSIVGVWFTTYTSGGGVWDMSFVTFHSDGTDNDNDMAPPPSSAICEGVWKWTGPRAVKRHHMGWLWDSTGTVLQGTFTLDETITLDAGGDSYTGTFSFQPLDLNGNSLGSPTVGTTSATRITVP